MAFSVLDARFRVCFGQADCETFFAPSIGLLPVESICCRTTLLASVCMIEAEETDIENQRQRVCAREDTRGFLCISSRPLLSLGRTRVSFWRSLWLIVVVCFSLPWKMGRLLIDGHGLLLIEGFFKRLDILVIKPRSFG
jgi:hypothetical protein